MVNAIHPRSFLPRLDSIWETPGCLFDAKLVCQRDLHEDHRLYVQSISWSRSSHPASRHPTSSHSEPKLHFESSRTIRMFGLSPSSPPAQTNARSVAIKHCGKVTGPGITAATNLEWRRGVDGVDAFRTSGTSPLQAAFKLQAYILMHLYSYSR